MNNKIYGKVKEVFLPNGEELTKIGFKIEIENKIITIIKEQSLEIAKIYRDDIVTIEKTIGNNIETYDIKRINDKKDGDRND